MRSTLTFAAGAAALRKSIRGGPPSISAAEFQEFSPQQPGKPVMIVRAAFLIIREAFIRSHILWLHKIEFRLCAPPREIFNYSSRV